MYNSYLAEATALLTEAAQELPRHAEAAAAIKANMAQAYAVLSLAQEIATANAAKVVATNNL